MQQGKSKIIMSVKQQIKSLRAPFYKILYPNKQKFTCPICLYTGPFKDKKRRLNAKCPKCGENERARLQYIVIKQLFDSYENIDAQILHIAPERALQKYFQSKFKNYTSADKFRNNVDIQFDVVDIPFPDASFNIVFASHILLYPFDDIKAISEMRRILKPNGIAIIPMPVFTEKTVDDYSGNARWTHMSGLDYYNRYRQFFPKVDLYSSKMFPEHYQLYIWDSQKDNPLAVDDVRREELVPVCYVSTES